jgi:hypothetical protein
MQIVIMLRVVMLSVVKLSVVLPNVVAPSLEGMKYKTFGAIFNPTVL